MKKHTPGPWQLWRQGIEIQSDPESEYFGHEVAVNINGIPCGLCCVPIAQQASNSGESGLLIISEEESLANAALMASAPELLESLQSLLLRIEEAWKSNSTISIHDPVVEKALSALDLSRVLE